MENGIIRVAIGGQGRSGYTHQFDIESVKAGLAEVTTQAQEGCLALVLRHVRNPFTR